MPAGSAYQGLILPAPRPKPVPAAQGGHGPPILIPHSPSTTYHPGAIQSHFAPAQAPSHGSYSSAGVSQAPAAVSSGAPQHAARTAPQEAPAARLARVMATIGDVQAASNPWQLSQAHPAVEGQILSTWFALKAKGFLPKTAPIPKIVFDRNETPGAGAYVLMNNKGSRELHVPPSFVEMAAVRAQPDNMNWVREATVHELAHTAQNSAAASSKQMVEGGAQAFAQEITPAVHRGQNFYDVGSGAYTPYVDAIAGREPNDWVLHNQFVPGAHAPMINMPTTPSFKVAMGKTGSRVGEAAQNAAIRTGYLTQPRNLPLGEVGKNQTISNLSMLGYAPGAVGLKVKPPKNGYVAA